MRHQVVPANPAVSVRGPAHVVRRGKIPVLTPDEARALIDGIDVSTCIGLRDRAQIGVMTYAFARVGNHSFRATGITAYLTDGGTLERAAAMANHASTRTTQL